MSSPIQSTNFSISFELNLDAQQKQGDFNSIVTISEDSESLSQQMEYLNMLQRVQGIVHDSEISVFEKMHKIKSECLTIDDRKKFYLERNCYALNQKEQCSLIHILCEMQFSKLCKTSEKNYLCFLNIFLDRGYRLDQKSSLGKTPLQTLLLLHYPHNRDIIVELLKKDVDITTIDAYQKTIFDSIWPEHFEQFIKDLLSIIQSEELHPNTKALLDFIQILVVNKKNHTEVAQCIQNFCQIFNSINMFSSYSA